MSFDFKTSSTGTIASFENADGTEYLKIDDSGNLVYESPLTGNISYSASVTDNAWYKATLTHYYAQGKTVLYVNETKVGELSEKLEVGKFHLSDANSPDVIDFRQLFFWRSGMNEDEIAALNNGTMLKSSLEIYAPLDTSGDALVNLAQSTNTLKAQNLTTSNPLIATMELRLFPNPTSNALKIQGLKSNIQYEYKIFGLDGKLSSEY